MAAKTRRPQTQKGRNFSLAMAMQDKRRGSAASPIPSGTEYNRSVKHRNRQFDLKG